MEVIESAKNTVIQFEETIDGLSKKYREKFGYGDSIRVVPYIGFGMGTKARVSGRVLADKKVSDREGQDVTRNLWNMLRRYRTDEVAEARLRVTIASTSVELTCDEEGYYDETIELESPLPNGELFVDYHVELLEPHSRNEQYETEFTGRLQVASGARFGLISDIDDTVVHTGATNLLRHAKTVVLNNAYTRVPFTGVAPFYTSLRDEQQKPTNPVFYVSSSPTNLYELFVDFMQQSGIPTGPIFLKDFGFEPGKFLKSGHAGYKKECVEKILEMFPHLSFILVGDSGQEDAEIYRSIVEDHGERILAVYIRDVTNQERGSEVEKIAREVEEMGIPMMLTETTLDAAKHAADQGWISPDELESVREHVEDPEKGGRERGMVGQRLNSSSSD